MKILLGNHAGAFSNITKILFWCYAKNESDVIFFFYANKSDHCNIKELPFKNIHKHSTFETLLEEEKERNFFYKFFEFPQGYTYEDFKRPDFFYMHYPYALEEKEYAYLGLRNRVDSLSETLIIHPNLFTDPNLQRYRDIYAEMWKKYLIPTKEFQKELDKELALVRNVKAQGKTVLAVFMRTPWHFTHTNVKGFEFTDMLKEIQEEMKHFDYILPITQVEPYFNVLKDLYPDRILELDRQRYPEMCDMYAHTQVDDAKCELEFRLAVIDVYLGSECNKIAGGLSNLFVGCLFLNPTVDFKVFKCLEGKNTC